MLTFVINISPVVTGGLCIYSAPSLGMLIDLFIRALVATLLTKHTYLTNQLNDDKFVRALYNIGLLAGWLGWVGLCSTNGLWTRVLHYFKRRCMWSCQQQLKTKANSNKQSIRAHRWMRCDAIREYNTRVQFVGKHCWWWLLLGARTHSYLDKEYLYL